MSTVGLTDARRSALALLADCRNADDFALALQAVGRTMLRALHADKLIDDEGRPNKRGHAALAAPRMTQAELNMLCYAEKMPDYHFATGAIFATAERLVERGLLRIESLHYCRSWRPRLTPAGRTALNNVRAAMGSPDWKEGL